MQAAGGFGEDIVLLAEGEADLAAAGVGVVVEDGVGDGDDAAAFGECAAEGEAVLLAQGGDVCGDEVRALGLVDLEPGRAQPVAEQVALAPEISAEAVEVRVRQAEASAIAYWKGPALT